MNQTRRGDEWSDADTRAEAAIKQWMRKHGEPSHDIRYVPTTITLWYHDRYQRHPYVCISYWDDEDEIKVEWYFEIRSSGRGRQRVVGWTNASHKVAMCMRLYTTGQSLFASKNTLLDVIRREWNKRRRFLRRHTTRHIACIRDQQHGA